MVDVDICLEALSAISGCNVQLGSSSSQLTPQDFVNIVALRQFYKQEGFDQLEYPSLGSLSLRDEAVNLDEFELYSAPAALEAPPAAPTGPDTRTAVKINPQDFFDRKFDYDFTNIKDGDREFVRGNERYLRPCGWKRVALKVSQKYDDGSDVWLGTGSRAWPVSYQGHNMDGSLGVIVTCKDKTQSDEFEEAAVQSLRVNQTLGRGIYSTPDVNLAEDFCKTFKSKKDGKKYKVLLQSRINPKRRKDCQRDKVWLVYIPENYTDVQTRALVQESVRPYGLLLKQV